MADGPSPREPVSLADAEVAAGIARAARGRRRADRTPTLEQLLAAFGEAEPTPEARRRVQAAITLAELDVAPSVLEAAPGERLLLTPAGPVPAGGRRIVAGVLAVGFVIAGAALAATLAGDDGNDRAADVLPETATVGSASPTVNAPGPTLPAPATTATAPATTATAPPATATAPAPTTPPTATTPTATAPAATTPAATAPAATTPTATAPAATTPATTTSPPAPRPPRRRSQRRASRLVTVRLAPREPTFLCVDDGRGRQLFNGTLTEPRRFRGRRIRLNIGLASTRLRVNGRTISYSSSPAGFDITRRRIVRLTAGRRPCA